MTSTVDRDLGMIRRISRRDFLNGVSLALTTSLVVPGCSESPPGTNLEQSSGYYPPALTGLRGSHPGSFEVAHQLRDGQAWDQLGPDHEAGRKQDRPAPIDRAALPEENAPAPVDGHGLF